MHIQHCFWPKKYKKESIGPWNWVFPITLGGLACCFGIVANLYPKCTMNIWKIEYGDQECSSLNILMNPVNHFFNKTEEAIGPLKGILSRTWKKCIADVGDNLFGENVDQSIKDIDKLDLQYIGMLPLLQRTICRLAWSPWVLPPDTWSSILTENLRRLFVI